MHQRPDRVIPAARLNICTLCRPGYAMGLPDGPRRRKAVETAKVNGFVMTTFAVCTLPQPRSFCKVTFRG